jgi:hypothetical protein
MKILMLVISSKTHPVYSQHREVWRTYMKSHPDIDCFFIEYSPYAFVPTLSSDTLTLRGVDRYETIFRKTLEALQYFLSRKTYDYVVRTNLSSVWDLRGLRAYLETAPRERVYAGQSGVHAESGVRFVSGAGIVMSLDVVQTLLANRRSVGSLAALDDVAIAKAVGLSPTPLPRVDFVSLAHYEAHHDKTPPGVFHYRVRHENWQGDRMEEPIIMRRLLREHSFVV